MKNVFLVSLLVFLVSGILFLALKPIGRQTYNNQEKLDDTPMANGAIAEQSPEISGDRCIITIDNQKYDVSQFRSEHEGGDIFNCGSDMTEKFLNQHPKAFLNKIEQYKVD